MKNVLLPVGLVLLAGGCSQTPPLAGGKPIDYWVQAMQSPDAKLRKTAVAKLGNAGAAEATGWAALSGALRDRDAGVRREAIVALMKCGPQARQTEPVLAEMARGDADPQVRAAAAKAVAKLRRDAAAVP
jgi:HEAT repeat protein